MFDEFYLISSNAQCSIHMKSQLDCKVKLYIQNLLSTFFRLFVHVHIHVNICMYVCMYCEIQDDLVHFFKCVKYCV